MTFPDHLRYIPQPSIGRAASLDQFGRWFGRKEVCLKLKPVVAAPLARLDEVSACEPEHPHVATGLVSHAMARLQRVEVIRFNIGYQPFETLVLEFVQRKYHAHPVEPLAAIDRKSTRLNSS